MKTIKLLLSLTIIFLSINANAQSTALNNNVITPAPQVATLMKFTEAPVSYFNGTADVNVPIYEIHTGDLDFPIRLNYHTSGIKVAEEAGVVGLGWNISTNAAVIDPTGNSNNPGRPDAAPPNVTWTPGQAPNDLFNVISEGEVFKNSQGVCTAYPQFQFQGPYANYDPSIRILNVNGIYAKFINLNGAPYNQWTCVDGQNIKLIENVLGIYTAIMPDGTQYNFNDFVFNSSLQNGANNTSATYLSSIVSPTGRTITFKYIDPPTGLQPVTITRVQSYTQDNIAPGIGLQDGFNYTAITEKFLSEIDFDNGKVLFNYGSRTDLASYALNSITVWHNGDSAPLKTINFNFDYFSYPEDAYGDYTTDLQNVSGVVPSVTQSLATVAYRQQRLKLVSVQINNDPPYSFSYDNTPMPYKTSWAQDIWGYFNGNTIKSLLPNYNDFDFAGSQVPVSIINNAQNGTVLVADRTAHFNFMKAGVLNRITYPTGGYTTFQYQPNTFPTSQGQKDIVNNVVSVNATGNGQQVQEFDIPDVGYTDSYSNPVNPVTITLSLFCGSPGGTGVCDYSSVGGSGGCSGYNFSPGVNPLDPSNAGGLWAAIQVEDGSGNWVTPSNFVTATYPENIFDWHNPDIAATSCTINNMVKNLTPGHYRIIANYPNTLTNGALGGPFASIGVTYKVFSTLPSLNNTGPGLRISSITDYSAGGQVATQRNITYSGGLLMTQPIFYRYLNNDVHPVFGGVTCVSNGTLWGASAECLDPTGNSCGSYTNVVIPRTVTILYSDPVIPYSYSANGSLFGYSTVYEQKVDGQGNDQGRTMYSFNCEPDIYQFYGWNLPGTQPAAYLDNGKLTDQQEQKDIGGGQYQMVRDMHYDYTIGTPATYWGYKCEYRPNFVNCSSFNQTDLLVPYAIYDNTIYYYEDIQVNVSSDIGAQDNSFSVNGTYSPLDGNQFLHFYPIRTGHVNLQDKIETLYDANNNSVVTQTNYTYNALNQPSSETTVKSNGKTLTTQTFWPSDYTSTGDFIATMQSLNMQDYPIEKIKLVNNLAVSAVYNQYYFHDPSTALPKGVLSPFATYFLKTNMPVTLIPSAPTNIKDSNYQERLSYVYDKFGNLNQQQQINGPLRNYIWDYNNSYPTAEITNATAGDYGYTSFEADAQGNWGYSGTPVLDSSTPFGLYSYNLASGSVSISNLIPTKTYILSYWTTNSSPYIIAGSVGSAIKIRTLANWTCFQHQLTNVSSVTISGTGSLDEAVINPSDAQMSTFIFSPLIGLASSTDAKGNTFYYNYDNDQRLTTVSDLNHNIMKQYSYHFAGWDMFGNHGTFTNVAVSGTFSNNTCGPGYQTSPATYTVPAGTYTSFISQADADGQALGDVNANGQNFANANTSCVMTPCTTPVISAIDNNSGLGITVHSNVIGGGTNTYLLNIYNNSTGEQVVGSIPITAEPFVTTLPAKGMTYKFIIVPVGPTCGPDVTPSQPFIESF